MLAVLVLLAVCGGCNGVFFQPNDRFYYHPHQFGLSHRELRFQSADGTRLHGWFLPAVGPSKATIIFFHGNAANISNHIYAVRWLPRAGYDVLLFDYRGYGQSEGEPDRPGAISDGAAAIGLARRMAGGDSHPLIVYGQSLGGALAVNALAEAGTEGVRALILESTFASYQEAARLIMDGAWITWPFQYPFAYLFFTDDQSPLDAMQAIAGVPALVIHREGDRTVPFAAGQALFDALPNPDKTFWAVPGGGHIVTFAQPGAWRAKLTAWIGQRLSQVTPEGATRP